jgi:hypothetical protein
VSEGGLEERAESRKEAIDDALLNLEQYVTHQAALNTGHGNVDDLLGFIQWYRLREAESHEESHAADPGGHS